MKKTRWIRCSVFIAAFGGMLLASSAGAANKLKVQFNSMNPHVGQKFELRVVDKATRHEVGRASVASIINHDFDIELEVIEMGGSYWIDFYADLNQNGRYDAPPADHAWRLELDNALGDTVLSFTHNTNFFDIQWAYLLTLNITSFTPHVGQLFEARVVDAGSNREVGRQRLSAVAGPDFAVQIPGLQGGRTYHVDFFADLNQNGLYDAPPVDHAWRLQAAAVQGDVSLDFTHNTNFQDVHWPYLLTLRLNNMNPHVGQKFEVRAIDLYDRHEIGRASLDAVAVPNFRVEIPGLQIGRTYDVDFYADFNNNGRFDGPPADHAWRERLTAAGDAEVTFTHNTNFSSAGWGYNFTLKLMNMNPHVGQRFEARLVDLGSMHEIGRVTLPAVAQPDFEVSIPGMVAGRTYRIDYYADLNQNGRYDTPPADHAWRDEFVSDGDTTLEFTHNTNFTAIEWPNLMTLAISNLNPHLGQKFEARMVDLGTGLEVGRRRLPAVEVPDFAVSIPGVAPGKTYRVDFYADFNHNGVYDGPPADHAWREQFSSSGDTTLQFTHNTNFTAIDWVNLFTLDLANMNPHVGQKLEARIVDLATMREVGRQALAAVLLPDFSLDLPGILPGRTYRVDFYADFNRNGLYDPPPADHAWREHFRSGGDTTLEFTHNTNFTDVAWPYQFTLQLRNMNPHLGQKFEMRVVEDVTGKEIGRAAVPQIQLPVFSLSVPGLLAGKNYHVDFYADFNNNGLYDPPPADHAWRDSFTSSGDVKIDFTHNTNFIDVDWAYLFTLALEKMSPHLGQLFELRVVDENSGDEIGRTRLESVLLPDFSLSLPGIRPGRRYRADYYADFNKNGRYDAPPADHAWRDIFSPAGGDTALAFTHNTNFTDIQWPPTTGIAPDAAAGAPAKFALLQNWPNPFNPETTIAFDLAHASRVKLQIYNTLGGLVRTVAEQNLPAGRYKLVWDGRDSSGRIVPSGVYFYRLQTEAFTAMRRMVLLR